MEDMDVPDQPGDGVIWLVSTLRRFCESFIKIKHDVLVFFDKEEIIGHFGQKINIVERARPAFLTD